MPLLDHFHAPLSPSRHWESFHGAWANEVMRTLNRRILPAGYFAEAQVHLGRVEIDVPTFEQDSGASTVNGNGGVAVAQWAPPAATAVMPAVFPDEFEVQVFQSSGGATLVAAIEFVSPANKGRPDTCRAFAAKCATYLQAGVGLIVVDVVTERQANLHDELVDLLRQPESLRFRDGSPLYAVAYRPGRRPEGDRIEMWLNGLSVGAALPTMPLALRGSITVPVDLEATYAEVCVDSRL